MGKSISIAVLVTLGVSVGIVGLILGRSKLHQSKIIGSQSCAKSVQFKANSWCQHDVGDGCLGRKSQSLFLIWVTDLADLVQKSLISSVKVLEENKEVTESEHDDNPRCVEHESETYPTIEGFDARTDSLPKCLETCGNEALTEENKFNRIINGITPDVNDWPFLVHLFFYNTPNISADGLIEGHLCGGTGRVYSST